MSSSMLSLDDLKRKPSRKTTKSVRGQSQSEGTGTNLLRQPSQVDLTKTLNKNTYFSDVNPRNMKRLMNIIAVTGKILFNVRPCKSRTILVTMFVGNVVGEEIVVRFVKFSCSLHTWTP